MSHRARLRVRPHLGLTGAVAMLLASVAVPSVATADKKPLQVDCTFIEIWATSNKPSIDPALKPIEKRLTTVFGGKWNNFKQLSSTTKTLAKKKPETLKLTKGSLTATLVEIVDNSKVRLTVEFGGAKLKTNQTQLVDAGDWVITVVQQANGDGHLLAGSCGATK